jgi:hypothetical protein
MEEEEEENYQHLVGGRTKSSCVIQKKKAVKNGELYSSSSSLNSNFTVDNIQLVSHNISHIGLTLVVTGLQSGKKNEK